MVFTVKVSRSEGWYVGEIPELHIVTQGKTLRELKANLKEALELTLESIAKDQIDKISLSKAKASIIIR